MSYILEALKKSEQEREQAAREQQAGAKAAIAYGQPTPKSRNYGALIVLVLLVNVGLVWYVFFNKAQVNTEQGQQQVAVNQISQSAKSVTPKPKPKPVSRKPKPKQIAKVAKPKPRPKKAAPKPLLRTANSVDSSKSVQSNKVAAKPILKSAVNNAQRLMASADTKSESVSAQQVKKAGRLPPEIDPSPVTHKKTVRRVAKPKALVRTKVGIKETAKPVVKPKVKKKTRPRVVYSKVELDASPGQIAASKNSSKKTKPRKVSMGPPHFDKMKPEFRRLFPKIDINVHVFDENPEDRFALIAMKRYVEGDILSGGITINEITPEGFILTYQKKTFTYPAK